MHDSVHVVIRSVEERTLELCQQLVEQQLPAGATVTIISEAPFERALRSCYLAGLDSGCQWTVTVDADVLLLPNALKVLLEEADRMPRHYAQLEGRVFDKVLGTYRQAGHRIYRTEILDTALKLIPPPGREIRPEYHTLLALGDHGHPSRRVGHVVGLHDFEQRYADLYRKAVVHARKHTRKLGDIVVRCRDRMHDDPDFLVILKGVWDGLISRRHVSIDRDSFRQEAEDALESLGLEEKRAVQAPAEVRVAFPAYFERATACCEAPPYRFHDSPASGPRQSPDGWLPKIRQRVERRGLARGLLASFGGVLKSVGRRLDR